MVFILTTVGDTTGSQGVDITPYIAFGGLKYQRSDVDDEDAGRAKDGKMYRNRISTKVRFDVTCKPLNSTELSTVLSKIEPEYFGVVYTEPLTNTTRYMQAYSNNKPATFLIRRSNGEELWQGVTFPVIER